ncbi:MAG: glycosyltransferase [Cypionkella sp.]|nr:glycosyltransferase [Cypionkella sp.]
MTSLRDNNEMHDNSANPKIEPEFTPQLSIIVPVFKTWHQLTHLLDALAAQKFQDFELIIADNEPQAFPEETLRQMVPVGLAGRWRRIHCAQPGSYAARNAAVAEAKARFVVFTDADCCPDTDWLSSYVTAERVAPEVLLAGPIQVRCPPFANAWQIFDTVRGIPQERYIAHGYATTANLGIPKAVIERLGGFDANRFSGGDAEFCRRAGRAGIGLRLVPGAVVFHPARSGRLECETKARRIKGGQLRSGPLRRRVFWTLRSLTPPLREMVGYVSDRRYSYRWRFTACAIRLRLWGVELAEMGRLLVLRSAPERR